MDLFKTDKNGKQPVFLNDVRFLDEAYRHGFQSIVKAMGWGENRILYGAILTNTGGDNYDVTDGAVVINGEILRIEAQSFVSTNLDGTYYKLQTQDRPDGLRTYGDSAVYNVYQVRKAQIVQEASPDLLLVSGVTTAVLSAKKYEPITSVESGVDEHFITPYWLGRSSTKYTGNSAIAPDDGYSGSYLVNSEAFLHYVQNSSQRKTEYYLNCTIASFSVSEIRLKMNVSYGLKPDFEYRVHGRINGAYEELLVKVLSNTPTLFEVTRFSGTFAASAVVEIWQSEFNLQ